MKKLFLTTLTMLTIASLQTAQAVNMDSGEIFSLFKGPLQPQVDKACPKVCGAGNWSKGWTCDPSRYPPSYKGCACECINAAKIPSAPKLPAGCTLLNFDSKSVTAKCAPSAQPTTLPLPCSYGLINCKGELQCANACVGAP